MRCLTAHQAKSKRGSGAPVNKVPALGSRLRENFDILSASRGKPVELIGRTTDINGDLIKLSDFYGLDVRLVQRGFHRNGYCGSRPSLYVLAGEWFGRVYIDYIAEHLASQDQSEAA